MQTLVYRKVCDFFHCRMVPENIHAHCVEIPRMEWNVDICKR